MINRLQQQTGQFIPITAMVTFTSVVFLVAVMNVYKVSSAKLKVQNLADAVALNIASQMASSMNKVADDDAWMNVMWGQAGAPQPTPGEVPDCVNVNPDLPPISCAENPTKNSNLNMFSDKGSATAYAGLVQRINQAQGMFIDAYNNFIGAGSGSNSSAGSKSSLQSILIGDIPELGNAGTSVFVWNDDSGKPTSQAVQSASDGAAGATTGVLNTAGMQKLKFQIDHDITITFKNTNQVMGTPLPPVALTLGQLVASDPKQVSPIGWMKPTSDEPTIKVKLSQHATQPRIGAGALIIRTIQVPVIGVISIQAQAQAFVVSQSGISGDLKPDPLNAGVMRPVFKPTYWVKLAGGTQS